MDGADSSQSPAGSQGQAHRTEAYLELPPPRTRPELAAFHRARGNRRGSESPHVPGGRTLLLHAGLHPQWQHTGRARCSMLTRRWSSLRRSTSSAFFGRGSRGTRCSAWCSCVTASSPAIDRDYHGFDYCVPEGDQGRFTTLRVLGDKHAGRATRRLRDDPHALERLRSLVGVPIRVLHLMRNPFDNIASIARNRDMPLSSAIAIYRKLGIAVDQTMTRLSTDELFEIRYEDLTADPTARLNEICGFIGVPATTDYLNRCATLIDHGGRRSRDSLSWSAEEIAMVEELIGSRPSPSTTPSLSSQLRLSNLLVAMSASGR